MDRVGATQDLITDQQGAMYVEYLVVLGAIALGLATVTVAIGLPILHNYRFAQLVITLPIP